MSELTDPALRDISEILRREVTSDGAQQLVADLAVLADESTLLDAIAASWLTNED